MYIEHPSFMEPEPNTTIWRYMDFTKFVSLLERRELFFSTIGILRQFDKHEGTYNQATLEASAQKPFSIHNIGSPLLRSFSKFLAVNCWHMSQIESMAMWDLYLRSGEGVAIKSTFQKLVDSLAISVKPEVNIGKVHYLSETDPIPESGGVNAIDAYLWKWNSYQHEQELRAIVVAQPEQLFRYNGIYVPVDLDILIEQVVISPKAQRWFSELVTATCARYGAEQKIAKSILSGKPGHVDIGMKLSVAIYCPTCNSTQEITVEPFQIEQYPDNSTILYSAERVSSQCPTCGQSFTITGFKWNIIYDQNEGQQDNHEVDTSHE